MYIFIYSYKCIYVCTYIDLHNFFYFLFYKGIQEEENIIKIKNNEVILNGFKKLKIGKRSKNILDLKNNKLKKKQEK